LIEANLHPALLQFAQRSASLRGNFKRIMAKSSDEREAEYLKHLDKVCHIKL
jgi:hypothetical protein